MTRPLAQHLLFGLLNTWALAPFALAEDVLVVDSGGGGSFATIQGAVDASGEGDVILIRAGEYTESVQILGRSVTLLADGSVRVFGQLQVRDLSGQQTVLLSGLHVELPTPSPIDWYTEPTGAVDLRDCLGSIRLQDCDVDGADFAVRIGFNQPDGSDGVLAQDCADVALIDTHSAGGVGSVSVVAVSGDGGHGVRASSVDHLTLVRSVLRGGAGGLGDDGGDGGSGVLLAAGSSLNVAYSALQGGKGGANSVYGTPNWVNDGGPGLENAGGTETFDLSGIYVGGAAGDPCQYCTPSGNPGADITNTVLVTTLSGFPNALTGPGLVREGENWSVSAFGQVGDQGRLLFSADTDFGFRPILEQPRLVGVPALSTANTWMIPGSAGLELPQQVPALGTEDARVLWIQARMGMPGSPKTFSSPRAVVLLRSGL